MNHDQAIENLRQEITEARGYLRDMHARPGCRAIDHMLARYLWGATVTADSIAACCSARTVSGVNSLVRYLFETLLDLHYLMDVCGDHLLEAAESTIVWDILEWDRLWRLYDEAVDADSTLDIVEGALESPDEAFERIRSEFESAGEDVSHLADLYMDLRDQGHSSHWSRKSLADRINALAGLDTADPAIIAMYRSLWPLHSEASHPSPQWRRVTFSEADGQIVPPDEDGVRDDDIGRVARKAREYLRMAREVVARYYELVSQDDQE